MNRLATPADLPVDIRLMNIGAVVLAALGAAALLATACLWVAHRPLFALKGIRVEGDLGHNSALTIRANAAPKLSGNFFSLDLNAGRRAFESVPWVRQAVLRRVWPDRLAVHLEEHRAAALWAGNEGKDPDADRLVNSHGEVFEANLGDVEDDALPTLRGPEGSSAQMLDMLGRLQPLFAPIEAHIETLEMSGRASWRVSLDDGATLELGRGTTEEVLARTQRFVATLPEIHRLYPQHPLLGADLRHNQGYALRLKGISTSGEPEAQKN